MFAGIKQNILARISLCYVIKKCITNCVVNVHNLIKGVFIGEKEEGYKGSHKLCIFREESIN